MSIVDNTMGGINQFTEKLRGIDPTITKEQAQHIKKALDDMYGRVSYEEALNLFLYSDVSWEALGNLRSLVKDQTRTRTDNPVQLKCVTVTDRGGKTPSRATEDIATYHFEKKGKA